MDTLPRSHQYIVHPSPTLNKGFPRSTVEAAEMVLGSGCHGYGIPKEIMYFCNCPGKYLWRNIEGKFQPLTTDLCSDMIMLTMWTTTLKTQK